MSMISILQRLDAIKITSHVLTIFGYLKKIRQIFLKHLKRIDQCNYRPLIDTYTPSPKSWSLYDSILFSQVFLNLY
jgi:hypothetical protein